MIKILNRKALPCPFCGCGDVLVDPREFIEEHSRRLVKICCGNNRNCGAAVYGYCEPGNYDEGYEKALKIWNRRAEP